MTTFEVKISGLNIVRKAIKNLDINKIVLDALEKQLTEPTIISTRSACPYCGKHTLTGQLDREYGESPKGKYLSTKCQDHHCGEIVFLTKDWKIYNPRTKLKSCPFCGSPGRGDEIDFVSCTNSSCPMAYSPGIAIETWNKRA